MNTLIREFEGCELKAYKCPRGIWTIGWGHTGSDVHAGLVITQKHADALYESDITPILKELAPLKFNKNQIDALLSFAYNCGIGSLRKVLAHMKEGETFQKASGRYNLVNGKVNAGLVRRRKAEAAVFDTKI